MRCLYRKRCIQDHKLIPIQQIYFNHNSVLNLSGSMYAVNTVYVFLTDDFGFFGWAEFAVLTLLLSIVFGAGRVE